MLQYLVFFKNHYDDILAIIGGLVTVCSVITRLTPTTKDDAILSKIVNVLSELSIYNTKSDQKIINESKKKKTKKK